MNCLTVTIRLGFPQPECSNYALSAFNESESEKLPQGPPLKFDSASFDGISQNRKYLFEITVFRKRTGNEINNEKLRF